MTSDTTAIVSTNEAKQNSLNDISIEEIYVISELLIKQNLETYKLLAK